MITIKMELDFSDLQKQCWSGAIDTLTKIEEANKESDFMAYLEELYFMNEELPTMTEINDFLWFQSEDIFDLVGLDEDGNELTDDEESEEE